MGRSESGFTVPCGMDLFKGLWLSWDFLLQPDPGVLNSMHPKGTLLPSQTPLTGQSQAQPIFL